MPNSDILPDEGTTKPNSIAIVVVFPAPLAPNRATTEFFFTSKEMLSTAQTSPNFFESFKTDIMIFSAIIYLIWSAYIVKSKSSNFIYSLQGLEDV